jgi:hypothetical protein
MFAKTDIKYLISGIQDKEKRQEALQMAEDADLDIATITKTVVENIRNRGPVQFTTDNKTELEAATSEVCYSLLIIPKSFVQCLIYDQGQHSALSMTRVRTVRYYKFKIWYLHTYMYIHTSLLAGRPGENRGNRLVGV